MSGRWYDISPEVTDYKRGQEEQRAMADGIRTVLFLCTGNYYRSRHTEAVFNHAAAAAGIDWRATSRGLAIEYGVNNVGPIARSTVARLTALGIPHEPYLRQPARVTGDDLAAADLIVALKDAEHRPLMTERHPDWVEKTEFWAVHDIDFATPDVALPQIEERVRALIARLGRSGSSPPAAPPSSSPRTHPTPTGVARPP